MKLATLPPRLVRRRLNEARRRAARKAYFVKTYKVSDAASQAALKRRYQDITDAVNRRDASVGDADAMNVWRP